MILYVSLQYQRSLFVKYILYCINEFFLILKFMLNINTKHKVLGLKVDFVP